eukprot:jgi/Ulvmu1/641/UM010_0011.1
MASQISKIRLPTLGCLRVSVARPGRVAHRAASVADVDTAVVAATDDTPAVLQPVDKVISARVVFDDKGEASVQYLARWKEDNAMTWEATANLSEDLVRDFEEAFWAACKAGDAAFIAQALRYGGATVANLVNSEGRAPLHFASALNNSTLVQSLLDAGADVDVADPEGYTPLHMAAGYLHMDVASVLLAEGADMTLPDRQGRDVVGLVESLRDRMKSATLMQQRLRLESVAKALTYFQYEDVVPAAVLRKRVPAVGEEGPVMYLISWRDDAPDSWVPEEFVSDEVKEDFEAGLEYAQASEILDSRDVEDNCGREYLVRWADGAADSWEDEDNVVASLVQAYEAGRRRGSSGDSGDSGDRVEGSNGSGEAGGAGGDGSGAAGAEARPAAAVSN